jgi:hypothetical protein
MTKLITVIKVLLYWHHGDCTFKVLDYPLPYSYRCPSLAPNLTPNPCSSLYLGALFSHAPPLASSPTIKIYVRLKNLLMANSLAYICWSVP